MTRRFNGFTIQGDNSASIVAKNCICPEYHIFFTDTGIEEYLRILSGMGLVEYDGRWYIVDDRERI